MKKHLHLITKISLARHFWKFLQLIPDITNLMQHSTDKINKIRLHFIQMQTMCFFIWWTHFRTNFTTHYFLVWHVFTYTNRFLLKCRLKKSFFRFFRFLLIQILPFQMFLSMKKLNRTFPRVNFRDHATYRWKALGEYIPKIYTFMGQRNFL